jgi:hypothetical protein
MKPRIFCAEAGGEVEGVRESRMGEKRGVRDRDLSRCSGKNHERAKGLDLRPGWERVCRQLPRLPGLFLTS